MSYIKDKSSKMESYEEILRLKEKIIQTEKEIIKECEEYKSNFKRKVQAHKNANAKTLELDLVNSALFGNGIIT